MRNQLEAQIRTHAQCVLPRCCLDHDIHGRLFLCSTEFKSSAGLPQATASVHPRAGIGQGGYSERVAGLFQAGPTSYSSALGTGAPTSSPDPFLLLFLPDHPRD